MLERTIDGVTTEKFTQLKQLLKEKLGVDLEGSQGEASSNGFHVAYQYDPATQVLKLQLLDKPWFVPEAMIESKLEELISKFKA